MLQKTVTRGKTKICGKILKQIIAEESTLKATIPENESHIYRKYVRDRFKFCVNVKN